MLKRGKFELLFRGTCRKCSQPEMPASLLKQKNPKRAAPARTLWWAQRLQCVSKDMMILPLISDGGRAAVNLVSEDKRRQGGVPRKLCRLVRHAYGWEGGESR